MLLLWYTSGVHKICAWDVFFWKLVLLENWSRFSLSQGGIELSFVRFNCPAISIFNDVVSRKSISLFCFVSGLTLLLEENIQKIDLSQYWQCSWTNFSTQSLPKPTLYYIFLVFLKLLYTGYSSKLWMGYNRVTFCKTCLDTLYVYHHDYGVLENCPIMILVTTSMLYTASHMSSIIPFLFWWLYCALLHCVVQ